MKVTLFAVGALILLSSIPGIFNNLVVVDTSAQLYEKEDRNEKIENNYNYQETTRDDYNMYNGYEEQKSDEYSSYDNYDPSAYKKTYDSSYNNNDDGHAATKTSYNNMDDKYSKYPTKDNKYECQRGPFEGFFVSSVEFCDVKLPDNSKPDQDKKFTCPDSGLVVDKKENCPVICPPESALEGHFVKAGSDLTKVCNVDTPSNGETPCLKCADLAITLAGNGPQGPHVVAAEGLIGTSTENIFTVCEADDPRDGFARLISDVPGQVVMNTGFDRCLDNQEAGQAQIASLQDSSLTTTVQAESAIPQLN